MSFIDLTQNTVWTDADIKARLHAIIRSEISEQAELEINRSLQGAAMGMYTLTDADKVAIFKFKQATDKAAAAGVQARADNATLAYVLRMEEATRRLAMPDLDTSEDFEERDAVQDVLDGATQRQREVFDMRNPPQDEVLEEQPTAEPAA